MTTDLRIQVAEACGWRWWQFTCNDGSTFEQIIEPNKEWPARQGGVLLDATPERPNYGDLPQWDLSWDAASELIERLAKEGWDFYCNRPSGGIWFCEFDKENSEEWEHETATAETLPLAICRAYLSVTRGGAKE